MLTLKTSLTNRTRQLIFPLLAVAILLAIVPGILVTLSARAATSATVLDLSAPPANGDFGVYTVDANDVITYTGTSPLTIQGSNATPYSVVVSNATQVTLAAGTAIECSSTPSPSYAALTLDASGTTLIGQGTSTSDAPTISCADSDGLYASSGSLTITGMVGDITGSQGNGIVTDAGGITISGEVGNISAANAGIKATGGDLDITASGTVGNINSSTVNADYSIHAASGNIIIAGTVGNLTNTNNPGVANIYSDIGTITISGYIASADYTCPIWTGSQPWVALTYVGGMYITGCGTTVTFDYGSVAPGGTMLNYAYVQSASTELLPTPTAPGYVEVAWYTSSTTQNTSTLWDFSTNTVSSSSPITLYARTIVAPAAPTGFTATPGDGQITLNWTAPSDNGGSAITGFVYSCAPTAGYATSWTAVPSSTASTTSYTVTSLTNGTGYTCEVAAVNAIGNGASSGTATATPVATINIAAITGVTAPVAGATPVTTITATAQYTGTVTWSPADATFNNSTVYTATITLTPTTGFTFTGVTANFFTVSGATTVSNAANSGVITAEFPATAPAALTGTATIDNTTPQIGDTLTASLSSTNNSGTLSYQWQSGGTNVGTNSSTYTVVVGDLGNAITVTITSSVETGSVTSTPTSAVVKMIGPAAPAAPSVSSQSDTTVVLVATAGYEYRVDSGTWQPSSTFAGLTASTSYTFTQRIAETATTLPSAESSGTVVTTDPTPPTTITPGAISGVTAPVAGATPVSSLPGTAEYTATISWSPAGATFAYSTVYIATITITPTTGFTLTGVAANSFTVAGATATNPANSGVITATFPITAAPPLTFTNSSSFDIPTMTLNTAIASISVAGGVSGGTLPYTFTAIGLPAGISISSTGVISGAPTAVGLASTATITVTDGAMNTDSITIAYGAINYAVIAGSGSTWIIGSTSGLSFTANGDFTDFVDVKVDGVLLTLGVDYTAVTGSTVIMLLSEYLATLGAGTHNIEIIFVNGVAYAQFTIGASAPGTGFFSQTEGEGRVAVGIIVTAIASTLLVAGGFVFARKKFAK